MTMEELYELVKDLPSEAWPKRLHPNFNPFTVKVGPDIAEDWFEASVARWIEQHPKVCSVEILCSARKAREVTAYDLHNGIIARITSQNKLRALVGVARQLM